MSHQTGGGTERISDSICIKLRLKGEESNVKEDKERKGSKRIAGKRLSRVQTQSHGMEPRAEPKGVRGVSSCTF